eukprot:gene22212-29275_t
MLVAVPFVDGHVVEKIDHMAIPLAISGQMLSALMVASPTTSRTWLYVAHAAMEVASFTGPVARTIIFCSLAASNYIRYCHVIDRNLALQLSLQLSGAILFVRSDGHDRAAGLQDHHVMHYMAVITSVLHVVYIMDHWRKLMMSDREAGNALQTNKASTDGLSTPRRQSPKQGLKKGQAKDQGYLPGENPSDDSGVKTKTAGIKRSKIDAAYAPRESEDEFEEKKSKKENTPRGSSTKGKRQACKATPTPKSQRAPASQKSAGLGAHGT